MRDSEGERRMTQGVNGEERVMKGEEGMRGRDLREREKNS